MDVATRKPRVIAVMLTHNRRDGAIRRCTEVLSQTRPVDGVVMVDNASTDETSEAVARRFPQVEIVRLPENLGPAGGFAVAFTEGMKRGCDFLWVLDDDVMISRQCLVHLLEKAATSPMTVVYPTRLPPDEKHGVAWRGILVPAEIVRAVGVPRADFFWHLEDTEYFLYRIVERGGFRRLISEKAVVWHGTHRPRRGFPGWKLYYQTRNSVYYRFYLKTDLRGRVKTTARILGRVLAIALREERGPTKALMMLRGVKDGLLGRLGKTVDPRSEPPSRLYHESPTSMLEEEEEARRRWGDRLGFSPDPQAQRLNGQGDLSAVSLSSDRAP